MVKGNVAMDQKIQKCEQENEGILTLAVRTENRAVTMILVLLKNE